MTNTKYLSLQLANAEQTRWAQQMVTERHYLHASVDPRCSPLVYLVMYCETLRAGVLIFGRPESTRCYTGKLTYGSVGDVQAGRAQYSRWEILNLARVWLSPVIQKGSTDYIPHAASYVIGQALRRVPFDYLMQRPPCFLDEPWELRQVLSYCDTRVHAGTLYRASNFRLVRTNTRGIETYARPVRQLTTRERVAIERRAAQSPRSQTHRRSRLAQPEQLVLGGAL